MLYAPCTRWWCSENHITKTKQTGRAAMHVLHAEEIRDSIVVLKWFKKEDPPNINDWTLLLFCVFQIWLNFNYFSFDFMTQWISFSLHGDVVKRLLVLLPELLALYADYHYFYWNYVALINFFKFLLLFFFFTFFPCAFRISMWPTSAAVGMMAWLSVPYCTHICLPTSLTTNSSVKIR